MYTQFLKSKAAKILLPILAVLIMVTIWQNGYAFGQWLRIVLN
jgi:hypothetical protein